MHNLTISESAISGLVHGIPELGYSSGAYMLQATELNLLELSFSGEVLQPLRCAVSSPSRDATVRRSPQHVHQDFYATIVCQALPEFSCIATITTDEVVQAPANVFYDMLGR